MPFKSNTELPASLRKLPSAAQTMFRKTFNAAHSRGNSESRSFQIAWAIVKKRFEKKPNGEWVAKTDAFKTLTFYKFKATPAEEFISRSENGNIIQNYVLTDGLPDNFGTSPTPQLMNEWVEWINTNQPEVDTDHQLWDNVTNSNISGNNTLIARAMSAKKGIAKAFKAVIDKGRVIVSLLFDKRYNNFVDRVKGLSIEAGVTRDNLTNKWIKGDLFGFTFATDSNPVNPRAVRV